MIQTLIPRPIAWVLSSNENGSLNLAPFSYFNAVASNPPLVMISLGKKPDGTPKDTRVNIEARKQFVIHLPHAGQLDAMNQSAITLPAGESELEHLGLETDPFPGSPVPRIRGSRIAYACELYEIHEIGATPQAMILGKANQIYIDDSVVVTDAKGRVKVDASRVDPIGRLGASEYMAAGEVLVRRRPA
nr:flavin reductase family protein [Motiliproteus sediminis]